MTTPVFFTTEISTSPLSWGSDSQGVYTTISLGTTLPTNDYQVEVEFPNNVGGWYVSDKTTTDFVLHTQSVTPGGMYLIVDISCESAIGCQCDQEYLCTCDFETLPCAYCESDPYECPGDSYDRHYLCGPGDLSYGCLICDQEPYHCVYDSYRKYYAYCYTEPLCLECGSEYCNCDYECGVEHCQCEHEYHHLGYCYTVDTCGCDGEGNPHPGYTCNYDRYCACDSDSSCDGDIYTCYPELGPCLYCESDPCECDNNDHHWYCPICDSADCNYSDNAYSCPICDFDTSHCTSDHPQYYYNCPISDYCTADCPCECEKEYYPYYHCSDYCDDWCYAHDYCDTDTFWFTCYCEKECITEICRCDLECTECVCDADTH